MSQVVLPKGQTRFYPLIGCLVSGFFAGTPAPAAPVVWDDSPPVKVACTGGSITWGYWDDVILQGKVYPDHLQRLLGPGYVVRNYGVSGSTAGRYPNHDSKAYFNTGEHVGTVQWRPNVIIAGLGINDCNSNWVDPVRYESGYRELVNAWRSPGQNPQVWIWNRFTPDFRGPLGVAAYPGNVFGPKYVFGTDDTGTAANRSTLQARVDSFAPDIGAGTIDAYSQLAILPQWAGEGLHFVEPGLKRLAELNFCGAWEGLAKSDTPLLSEACPTPGSDSPRDETNTRYPWVELHNPFTHGVLLDGLAIDSGANTTRFEFANSTVLFPGERRIVFLSSKNLNQPTKPLHANFSVNGGESQIRLISRSGAVLDAIGWKNWYVSGALGRSDAPVTRAVASEASHRRLVTSAPPSNWVMPAFDDSGWVKGAGGTGYELPARAENQFATRWNCDTLSSTLWALGSSSWGNWTPGGDGTANVSGPGPYASLKGGQWIQGADSSWTVEVKVKLNIPTTGTNDGFVIRGGTQAVGGGYAYLYIEPGRTLFGNPKSIGKVLSTAPNDDDYHTFRMAYHAPTRRFFVWRDGVEISRQTCGLMKDTSRYSWLTIGAVSSTQNVQASVDYASLDRTGAYAPYALNTYEGTLNPAELPLASDPTASQPANGSATCLVRVPFDGLTATVTGIKLNVEFDDGFSAWINGVPVAVCNAPSAGLAAPLARDDAWGVEAVTLDLSEFAGAISPGENVLALQVYNSNSTDGRCFIRASLDLSSAAYEVARYYSPVTASAANGSGAPLPAQGWLLESLPPAGGTLPLTLADDTDGDGRSNLLEHSQGTNPMLPDSAPVLTASGGFVNFQWRNNPEVGWRLMESSGQSVWRPANITGPATASPSGTAGMLDVSQPVATTAGLIYRLAAIEQPSLTTWQQRHFSAQEISAAVITHPDADPDSDGLPNFLEFAIASDPRSGELNWYLIGNNGRSLSIPDVGTNRGAVWSLQSGPNTSNWSTLGNPDIRCGIHPVKGTYLLELSDPTPAPGREFLRAKFLRQ
jgi:hypothetical protein